MKRICSLKLILAASLATSALAQDPAAGLAVYESKCQRCHGADARGDPEMAAELEAEFKFLGSEEVQALTDVEIRQLIIRGKGKMTSVQGMTVPGVMDVIAYLRTLGE